MSATDKLAQPTGRTYPFYLTTFPKGQVVAVSGPATIDGDTFTFPNTIDGYSFTCQRSEISRTFANKRAAQRWCRNMRKLYPNAK